jgi:hypothetical protein
MNSRIQYIVENIEGKDKKLGAKCRMASRLSVSEGLIGDWIKGRSTPKKENQEKICEIYGINSVWLLTGVGSIFNITEEELGQQSKLITSDLNDFVGGKDETIKRQFETIKQKEEQLAELRGAFKYLEGEKDKLERANRELERRLIQCGDQRIEEKEPDKVKKSTS